MDTTARRLARAEERVQLLERMIEDKTRELYLSNDALSTTVTDLRSLLDAIPGALLILEADGTLRSANGPALELLGFSRDQLSTLSMDDFCASADSFNRVLESPPGSVVRSECEWISQTHGPVPVLASLARLGAQASIVCVAVDLRERKHLEVELRHAQKLEAVGQLAAGIAHEINTPMQFIGDNLNFLEGAMRNLLTLVDTYDSALRASGADCTSVDAQRETLDFEFLASRGPKAATRALEGVQRVASLVSAMKAFSHPTRERAPTDLNASLQTTLTVARNEYKYVADVETDFGQLPLISCSGGDLNQVFLNLVVNAAHAIEAKVKTTERRGRIRISTRAEANQVVIAVEDSGCGIPEAIRHRIFDPFFTTKEVGKGTGQGLAISRSVVDAHGGTLTFESVVGQGTTFFVRLPVDAAAPRRAA